MTKARKRHTCTLCFEPINKGTEYIYRTITIWDHLNNEGFSVYKAHKNCDDLWQGGVGMELDWIFPECGHDWAECINERQELLTNDQPKQH